MALLHMISQLIVFGMILGILDAIIVIPPGIVATPRIVDPPRRTIILLDSDFAGSGIGAFGGDTGLLVLVGLSLFAMPVMGPDGTTMTMMQSMLMTMMQSMPMAMTAQPVATPAPPSVITVRPPVTPLIPKPAPCVEEQCVAPFMAGPMRKCYYMGRNLVNWADATANCEARGAVLVEPTSKAEVDAVYALLNTDGAIVIWTGANELNANGNSENNARFTPSGNPLGTFFNAPDSGICQNKNDRDCVGMFSIIWCYRPCTDQNKYICEQQQLNTCP